MADQTDRLSETEVTEARERRLVMQHLQDIEGNPLDADDIAMFEMFERERWSHDRRRKFILDEFEKSRTRPAAE